MQKLPRWMRRAIKDNVLSPDEAQMMFLCAQQATSEEAVILPPELFQAAKRLYLWELPANQPLRPPVSHLQ